MCLEELPCSSNWKEICLWCRRPGFDPWVGKIPWSREWQPTPVFLPGQSRGQRSLVLCVHGVSKSQTQLSDSHYYSYQMCCEQLSSPPSTQPVVGMWWSQAFSRMAWICRVCDPLLDDPLLDSWGLEKGGKDKRKWQGGAPNWRGWDGCLWGWKGETGSAQMLICKHRRKQTCTQTAAPVQV